jgi:negative regulator of sigma E activity
VDIGPSDWQVTQAGPGEFKSNDTGWTVNKVPPGFIKISEGFRTLAGQARAVPRTSCSPTDSWPSRVFVEPYTVTQTQIGLTQAGGLAQVFHAKRCVRVTVIGEAPPATVQQIAQSVSRNKVHVSCRAAVGANKSNRGKHVDA